MKVRDCMSQNVCFCAPEATIADVAKLMNENHVGCIPVCDSDKKILGLVTDRDIILRGIACDKDAKNTKVNEIMTSNVCHCEADKEVTDATKLMSDWQVRRIPIVENNKLIGILTLGDLAKEEVSSNEVSRDGRINM